MVNVGCIHMISHTLFTLIIIMSEKGELSGNER